MSAALRQRIQETTDCRFSDEAGPSFHLECRDAKSALVRLIATLNEAQAELIGLELEEPSLERVFLHLTGRALRD
jgi:ABC-2 type transport system ATP-binding protein